jgi:hypothetical protein
MGGAPGTICGFTMSNPASSGLPNPASYDTSVAGIVTDKVTGLAWHRGMSAKLDLSGATAYCSVSNLGGFSDWRLPTVIELVSLVDFTRTAPAIDSTVFPGAAGGIWSDPAADLSVEFTTGSAAVGNVGSLAPVRCVRSASVSPVRCYFLGARYQISAGSVSDIATGLTWRQSIAPQVLTWAEADAYCNGLGGGFRLPSMKELQTIVDLTGPQGSKIDSKAFPGTPNGVTSTAEFWTSSRFAGSSTAVWEVDFYAGRTYNDDASQRYQTRCVR